MLASLRDITAAIRIQKGTYLQKLVCHYRVRESLGEFAQSLNLSSRSLQLTKSTYYVMEGFLGSYQCERRAGCR